MTRYGEHSGPFGHRSANLGQTARYSQAIAHPSRRSGGATKTREEDGHPTGVCYAAARAGRLWAS